MPLSSSENYSDINGISPAKSLSLSPIRTEPRSRGTVATPAVLYSELPGTPSHISNQATNHPRLAVPELAAIDLIALLKELQRTNTVTDVKVALMDAKRINTELETNKAQQLEKMQEAQRQQTEMDNTSDIKKWLSLVIGAIGLVVAAVVLVLAVTALTVATAGAAAPAGVVLASLVIGVIGSAFGAVMGALSVANSICQVAGVTRENAFGEKVPVDVSVAGFATLMDEVSVRTGTIKIVGVNAAYGTPGATTREDYEKHQAERSTVINIGLAVIGVVLAIASIASAFAAFRAGAQAGAAVVETAEATTQTATQVRNGANLAVAVASVVTATGSGINAGFSIDLALKKNDRAQTQIDEKTIEALIQTLQQMFDTSQQHFKSAMNFQETLRSSIASTMETYYENSMTIAKNTRI